MSKIFSALFLVFCAGFFSPLAWDSEARDNGDFPDKIKIFQEEMTKAIEDGDLDRVVWIAEFFSDIGVSLALLKDENGLNPLHRAVLEDQKPIIHYLLKASKGGLVNLPDKSGDIPLYLALKHKKPEDVIRFLVVEGGTDMSGKAGDGSTALHLLVHHSSHLEDGGLGLARLFVAEDTPVNELDNQNDTAFHKAIKKRKTVLVKFFIFETEIDWSLADAKQSGPLHLLISYYDDVEESLSLVKDCVDAGAPVNVKDGSGNAPVHLALIERKFPIANYLIDYPVTNLNLPGKKGLTVFQMAILYGAKAADEGKGAEAADGDEGAEAADGDEGAEAADGDEGAEAADGDEGAEAADGDEGAEAADGDEGAEAADGDEAAEAADGDEAAEAADGDEGAEAADGDEGARSIAYAFLEKDISVNDRSDDGNAALHTAIIEREFDLAKILILEKGADVTVKSKGKRRTPLHLACIYGAPLDVLEALVSKGALVNRKSKGGYACMHFAVEEGDLEIVKWLDKKGADINGKTEAGHTPFMLAEDVEIIVYLGRRLKEEHEAAKKAAAAEAASGQ